MLLIYVGLLTASVGYAQSAASNKLIAEINLHKPTDTNKVKLYTQLAQTYYGTDPVKLLSAADSGLQIAKAIKWQKGEGDCNRWIGIGYYLQGNFTTAKQYFSQAFTLYTKAGHRKGVISSLSNLGSIANVQNNYTEALQLYQQSVKQAEQEGDYLLMGINYGNIGIIYNEIEDFEEAKKYFQKGILSHQKANYQQGIAVGLGNMGNALFKQKLYKAALVYYDSALQKNIQLNSPFDIARERGNCANAQLETNKLSEAYNNLQQALTINIQMKNKKGHAVNKLGLANYFKATGNIPAAEEAAQTALALADEVKVIDVQYECCKILSELNEAKNENDSAYHYFKKYIDLKSTIDNEATRKKIVRMGLQYDFDAKEQKYITEQQLSKSLIGQQQLQLALNKANLSESIKQQEIQRIQNLKAQADLKNEQLESEAKNNEVILLTNEKNIQGQQIRLAQQQQNLAVEKQKLANIMLQRTWLYGLLTFLILGIAALLSIIYWRTKSLKAKNILSAQQVVYLKQELALQNEIKLAEMSALRSQMNPHFIFNALNAINSFVLKNNTTVASDYIGVFSKLMRHVLSNSAHNTIPLSKEVEVLELYLKLEQARMGNRFQYQVKRSSLIDDDFVQVPPLLLQPFVENAIWHGIQPKQGGGLLNICIQPAAEEGVLIQVEDNGIGRKASCELRPVNERHQSKGIEITLNRLLALNSNNKIEYTDLKKEDGSAAGTAVAIYLY